jgi:F-type H+-transporting ATPase subunit epsilon
MTFKLKLIDIDGTYFQKDIKSLILSTPLGEISILPNHCPIITVVNSGKIRFRNENDDIEELDLLNDAILEFKENEANLLTMFR